MKSHKLERVRSKKRGKVAPLTDWSNELIENGDNQIQHNIDINLVELN